MTRLYLLKYSCWRARFITTSATFLNPGNNNAEMVHCKLLNFQHTNLLIYLRSIMSNGYQLVGKCKLSEYYKVSRVYTQCCKQSKECTVRNCIASIVFLVLLLLQEKYMVSGVQSRNFSCGFSREERLYMYFSQVKDFHVLSRDKSHNILLGDVFFCVL